MFLRFSPAKRNVCTSSINRGVVLQADIFKNLGQLNSTIVVAVCSMVQRVLVVLQFDGLPCFFLLHRLFSAQLAWSLNQDDIRNSASYYPQLLTMEKQKMQ